MHVLAHSFRQGPASGRIGDVDDSRPVRLTVVLRPGTPAAPEDLPGGEYLSHQAYAQAYGTPQAVLDRVVAFARAHGMTVLEASAGKHAVWLEGTYGQARAAFQPDGLGVYRVRGRDLVARHGHVSVPQDLADDVVAVLGFDQRPLVRSHFRIRAHASNESWAPEDVARHYAFPTGVDGTGQTIALIEFGGGYDPGDVDAYFTAKGVRRSGRIIDASVDGGRNSGGADPTGADGEVQLDIDICGSVAPGADIVVYFAPNQGSGFVDAIQAAIADQTHAPSVISISWGGPEGAFPRQDMAAINQALQSAAALGITVCVASGDQGAQDGSADGSMQVDFPASSPYALGCGGTRLDHAGAETAWNDGPQGGASGGGYSAIFPIPAWQQGVPGVQGRMRGVPDVAGNADPATGYKVRVDGQATVAGGTSAVAPLWAGLVCLLNQMSGKRSGLINPALYQNRATFTDIVAGNNNGFEAGPGWDPVTGLGSPRGTALAAALQATARTS